jgi:Ca2+/Na+ antiporter
MTFYREFNGKIQEIICSFDKKPNDEDMEVGSSLLYSFLYIVKPISVAHICFYGETKEDKFWNLLKTILIIVVFMLVFAFFMSLIRFKQSTSPYFWAAFFFCYMIFIPFIMRYTNESGKEYNKYREEFFEKKNVKQ